MNDGKKAFGSRNALPIYRRTHRPISIVPISPHVHTTHQQ